MKIKFCQSIIMAICIAFFAGLCPLTASSQGKPIKWRCFAKMASPTDGIVTVKAVIAPGWHLYGLKMPENGPKATVITFSPLKNLELIGQLSYDQTPIQKHDNLFDVDVTYWEHKVEFTQKFKITGPDPSISGTVNYMGCNDETCLPPASEPLKATIIPYNK